jgi:DNA invertase Pin-like site-specific DNA recombinase
VKSGLANAKRKGRKLGRRKVVSQSMSDKIWELRQSGNSYRSIGKQLGISFMSVKRELDRFYIPEEC